MLIYIDLIRHKVSCINESPPKVCLSKFKASHMKWKNISRDSKTFKNPPPLFFPGLLQNLWVLWYTLYILFIWPIYLLFIEKNRRQRITSRSDNKSGPSQTGGWGLYPPQFLAKQLTLSQPGGQIIPTRVLGANPQIFRPCDGPASITSVCPNPYSFSGCHNSVYLDSD